MERIFLTLWLALITPLAFAIPTAPSVTFGTTTDPNTLSATQFNKYDGSVFVKTSDGTANGTVDSVWHYSVKNNKWVKVPTASWGAISGSISSQTDLQSALSGKQSTLSLTTTGSGAATLSGATLNVPTPNIPAQFNPTAGAGVSITGTYPNMTLTNTSLNTDAQTLTSATNSMSISGGNSVNIINSISNSFSSDTLTTAVNGSSAAVILPMMKSLALSNAVASTSITRANVTGWSFAVTAGKNYRIEVVSTYQTAAITTGGSLGFILPTGAGTIHGALEGKITSTPTASDMKRSIFAVNNSAATAGSFITTTGVGTINQPHQLGGVMVFNCTTSGTFQVQWGSEVAASNAQLNSGSTLYVTEF